MTRAEHLAWCKERALQYVAAGDTRQAFASMVSDLRKHDGTADHAGMQLGGMLLLGGHLDAPEQMRDFIRGFN